MTRDPNPAAGTAPSYEVRRFDPATGVLEPDAIAADRLVPA